MKKEVIIALDFPNKEKTLSFLNKFTEEKPYVKIGMELFYAEGPSIVTDIKKRGHKVFLDLKLHDIPNTVESSMKSLLKLNADMYNLHGSGTKKMMEAAVRGLTREDGSRPLLIAVTQLTSTSEEVMKKDLLIDESLENVVSHYAKNAKEAGLDGVVCSPLESPLIHEVCGLDFLTVTPGVRFAEDSKGDQVRITTPEKANRLGSDFIVVGRSITGDNNPVEKYLRCKKEFTEKEV